MAGMDFAVLPPELNSARMYAGPGTGPMLAAAGAWRGLAGELSAAASAYQDVIAGLTGQSWFGPASQSMAAATTPYANWLGTTAGSAEHTAGRLMQAVSDFEQAFAATVPPAAIAANRSLLAALVAANVVGQNTTAIAAAEADYNQMWLQDAMAMYSYAARSATASAVQPFTAPPPVVDPAGSPAQGVASGQAAAGSTQAAPAGPVSQAASYLETLTRSVLPANDTNISALYGMGQYARNLNTDLDISQATGGRAGFGSGARSLSSTEPTLPGGARPAVVAACSGRASAVGKLTVPPAWIDSLPEVTTTTTAEPATPPAAVAVAGLAGRAGHRRGRTASLSERSAGELIGTNEVRHWHVEPAELKSVLGEVAAQPGVHEVHFDIDEPPQTSPRG